MRRSPVVALILSAVVPGTGQLYNGERAKGIAFLCLTLGTGVLMALATWGPSAFRSRLTQLVLVITYLFVWIPAVFEAYRGDPGTSHSVLSGDRPWYVIFMVLVIGAMALPLVWQSRGFSRTTKIVWSTLGILNTLLALLTVALLGSSIERWLNGLSGALNTFP